MYLSLSYIPSYVYARPGYREKSVMYKGHKSYMWDFITEYQGRTDPTVKTVMHIMFSVHAVWLQMVHDLVSVNGPRTWVVYVLK